MFLTPTLGEAYWRLGVATSSQVECFQQGTEAESLEVDETLKTPIRPYAGTLPERPGKLSFGATGQICRQGNFENLKP